MNNLEIEGKWLIKHVDESLLQTANTVKQIRQGYVCQDKNGTLTRVRQANDKYYLTIKGMANKGSKIEIEREIDIAWFEEIWPLTEGKRVEKKRYIIPFKEDLYIELDIFEGSHAGLVLAEIEVNNESVLEEIRKSPPVWFGDDVTEDIRYANSELAQKGLPQ